MDKVALGKVVKLHGFLGNMKIMTKFDKGFDIKNITKLYDENGQEFVVTRIFSNTDAVVVALEGVDLERAKSYINKTFYIDRKIVSGKILFEDLKDSKVVFETGESLGDVTDVQDFGAAEVVSVMCENGKEIMFPNVKGVIESFDYKLKKLVLNKSKFKEVADYED